jgi:hypothetical protein
LKCLANNCVKEVFPEPMFPATAMCITLLKFYDL